MVNERKKQEAQTFLGKKGIEYALNYASRSEERRVGKECM